MSKKEKREAFISQKVAQGMSRTQAKKSHSGNRPTKPSQSSSTYKGNENDGINIDRSSNSPWQDCAHTSDDI